MDTATQTSTHTATDRTATLVGTGRATQTTCGARTTTPTRERLTVRRGLAWGPRTR